MADKIFPSNRHTNTQTGKHVIILLSYSAIKINLALAGAMDSLLNARLMHCSARADTLELCHKSLQN